MCPGGQINLTCQAAPNETLLQWSLHLPGRSQPELRYLSSRGMVDSVTPLTVGQTEFQFFRTSTMLLISKIIISNVSIELNGTRVDCFSGGSLMSETFINVIKNGMINCSIKVVIHLYHLVTNSYHFCYLYILIENLSCMQLICFAH